MWGLWKRSKARFYWLNTKWNLGFWLHAKPCYEEKVFVYTTEHLDMEKNLNQFNLQAELDKERGVQKRFKGYLYRGGLYMDNPGPQCSVDQETRAHWLKKHWI